MTTRSAQHDTPPIAYNPETGVSVVRNLRPCESCGIDTKIRVHNRPGHFSCLTGLTPPTPRSGHHDLASSAVPGGAGEARDATPVEASMFALLKQSIEASKKRPVLRVLMAERATAPWSLMTEAMRGEHRYRVDAPEKTVAVKPFDRNGSYPSAMANVPVAAALLQPTAAIGYSTAHAGLYQVPAFTWTDGPHPFGEIAEQPGPAWWITTPHLRLAVKLVAQQRIPAFTILDSYTAPAVTNLFKVFSADVSTIREDVRGTDEYDDVKRRSSIAIRGLWPKAARSPFWRADWSLSVRAEASVRHWVRADQAIQAGATLLKLGSVDEVAFVQPPRARQNWAPEPYKIGLGFGYVTANPTQTAAEWNRGPRR